MQDVDVVGLTPDRQHVVLRHDEQLLHVRLSEVHRAEQQRPSAPAAGFEPLTPKLIQQRIRAGESAEQVAATGDWAVEVVRRYEGPVLAEREHHARAASRVLVDDVSVADLVARHLGADADQVEWDSRLVAPGQWEVQAQYARQSVVLRWEPAGRSVKALDEPSRKALREVRPDDALTAVLRPLSARSTVPTPPPPARNRRARAEVPVWDDISRQVTGGEQPHQDDAVPSRWPTF